MGIRKHLSENEKFEIVRKSLYKRRADLANEYGVNIRTIHTLMCQQEMKSYLAECKAQLRAAGLESLTREVQELERG